jgi:hypothetical protein
LFLVSDTVAVAGAPDQMAFALDGRQITGERSMTLADESTMAERRFKPAAGDCLYARAGRCDVQTSNSECMYLPHSSVLRMAGTRVAVGRAGLRR